MTQQKNRSGRRQVRAENQSGACGHIGHMTIDELKARAAGDSFGGSCPAGGMFLLSRADIERLNAGKISESEYFAEMGKEAKQD